MKRTESWCLMLGFLFLGTWAQAGAEKANGGQAVVCYADSTQGVPVSIQLFDHWEMKQELNLPYPLDLGGNELSVSEKIDYVTQRLAKFDLARAVKLRNQAREISDHIDSYLGDVDLKPIDDDNARIHPRSPCYTEQMAVQIQNPLPFQKRFLISRRLYESPLTSKDTQAGLILHEVIYREAIELGQTTSELARYYNYMISTRFLDSTDVAGYESILKNSGFEYLGSKPVQIPSLGLIVHLKPDSIEFGHFGTQARLAQPLTISSEDLQIELPENYPIVFDREWNLSKIPVFASARVRTEGVWIELANRPLVSIHFHPNGKPGSFHAQTAFTVEPLPQAQVHCRANTQVILHPNGRFHSCGDMAPLSLTLHQQSIASTHVTFSESGGLEKVSLAQGEEVSLPLGGCEVRETFRSQFHLDPQGKAESGYLKNPVALTHAGKTYPGNFISSTSDCKATFEFAEEVFGRRNGLRILGQHYQSGKAVCQHMGYSDGEARNTWAIYLQDDEDLVIWRSGGEDEIVRQPAGSEVTLMRVICERTLVKDYASR